MALGIGRQAKACLVDRAALPDAGQHVLQRPPFRQMIENVAGGHQKGAMSLGQCCQGGDPRRIVAAIMVLGCQIKRPVEQPAQPSQPALEHRIQPIRRQQHQMLAGGMQEQILDAKLAAALGGAPLAQREQLRQPAVSGSILGEAQEGWGQAIGRRQQIQPGADQKAQLGRLGCDMPAHHPGQRVAVGERDRAQAQLGRAQHQLLRMGAALQERKVRGDLQLGIAGHGRRLADLRRTGHADTSGAG